MRAGTAAEHRERDGHQHDGLRKFGSDPRAVQQERL
jgi:hypothetical protein